MNHSEESVIGSILLDNSCMADLRKSGLKSEYFSPGGDDVFRVIEAMAERGDPIDAVTLPRELIKAGVCEDQGHADFVLLPCLDRVPNAAHADYYAKHVIEYWQERKLKSLRDSIAAADQPVDEQITALRGQLDRIDCATGKVDSGIVSAADLQTQYSDLKPVLVDGLIRRGETANVISATKVGKSWLSYDLCLSVATGNAWCGRFTTKQGRVLLIDNELHKETLAYRISKVTRAMGLAPRDYADQFDTLALRGRLKDIFSIRRTIESIPQGYYSLIVVDAWYRMIPDGVSENGNSEMTQLSNCVDQYAAMTDAAWVPIHHSTKGDQSDKRVTDVGSGAGSMARAADSHIVLREHEAAGHFVLDAAVRSFPPVDPVTLRWEFPRWHVADHVAPKLATRQTSRQSAKDKEGIGEIRDALSITDEDQEMWLSVSAIRKATSMGLPRVEKLLGVMETNSEVISQSGTYQNKPTTEYRLAKQP
tara:strand:- start:7227 stop:8663 length:1437 start_codon:yes stop_codon:yes gene_type:complete